jgi:hypothetical protein
MRSEVISLVKLLHDEMKQLSVDSGVSPEIYEAVLEYDNATPDVELEALHTWLQVIFEGAYQAVEKVWRLHPRRRWDYYYSMGEELTEVKLLNKARRRLYEEWKKPYYVKGHRIKRPKHETVENH